jgi:hypothetical protein
MDVISLCPLRVGGFVWQSRSRAYALTVVAKATYVLAPEECVLAPEQEPPNEADNHWDDDPARSVYAPSDWAPMKERADVVLVGHAFAPGGQPVRSLMTRMLVGSLDKSIEVWCDRGYRVHDGQLLEGPRFAKMSLRWERAAGGPDTYNPVGLRFDAEPDRYGMVAIPNLQPPGVYVSRGGDTFMTVGFGPIAGNWPGRLEKLGRSAGSFLESAWEGKPLPEDPEYQYFNVAPPDQQVEELRANERLVLENLHPKHARLVTSLPGLKPRAVLDRTSGEREKMELRADTLWIDTDRGICTLVWRGCVGLRHAQEAGRVTIWADGGPALGVGGTGGLLEQKIDEGSDTVTALLAGVGKPVLPFVPGVSRLAVPEVQTAIERATELAEQVGLSDGTGTLVPLLRAPRQEPLPFGAGRESAGQPQGEEEEEKTLVPPVNAENAVPPPPPVRFGLGALLGEVHAVGSGPAVEPGHVWMEQRNTEEQSTNTPPAPPPMVGPLATPEIALTHEPPTGEAGTAASSRVEAEAHAALGLVNPAPLQLEKYTLERCAAIAASIDRRNGNIEQVMKEEGLEVEEWNALHAHWLNSIDADVDRGRKKMLSAYDAAYVERLEQERGPITAVEYTRLLLAAERRVADAELKKLGLPDGSMMRIRRVWLSRIMMDPKTGAEVQAAMRGGHEE